MLGKVKADEGQLVHVKDLRNRLSGAVVRLFDLPDITRCLKVDLVMADLPEELEDFRGRFQEILDAPKFYYDLEDRPIVSYRIWGTTRVRRYLLHHLTIEIREDKSFKISIIAEFKEHDYSEGKDVELLVKQIKSAEPLPEGWPNSALSNLAEQ